MKWREPITLTVRILSPVVIGTGEKCNTLWASSLLMTGKFWWWTRGKFFAVIERTTAGEIFELD